MKNRRDALKMNALFAALIALVIAIVLVFNAITLVLSSRYPLFVDLNANEAYRVGQETKKLLASLEGDIVIYVLATKESFDANAYLIQARSILDQYPLNSTRVKLHYVDYAKDPSIAAKFADLSLAEGNILVTAGDKVKQVLLANLFNYTHSSAAGGLVIESSRAETALTSAIQSVTAEGMVRLGTLLGNGVSDMAAFITLLQDNNYHVESVNMLSGELDAYDGLMLFAPAVDLSEDVLKKLDGYLYNGGDYGKTLFYTASVAQGSMPNLEAFLREWGVGAGDGAVFETRSDRTYNHQPYYPVTAYAESDRPGKLKNAGTPFLAPLAKPLSLVFTVRDNRHVEELLSFSDTSGVRPSDASDNFTASQATVHGPMPALTLSSVRIYGTSGVTEKRSNLLVSSSTEAFAPTVIGNTSLSNMEYTLNLFAELFKREGDIWIESKSLSKAALGMTTGQANTLGVLLAGVVPGLILLIGVGVFLIRRYK